MKKLVFVAILTLLCGSSLLAADFDAPIKTRQGLVSGAGTTAAGIHVYKGIPFAASAAGEGRWRPPAPRRPWTGVLKADHFAPVCYQKLAGNRRPPADVAESEDCLYLNVWTPAKTAADKLPVMVWIYGGGYNFGSTTQATYDGENLARKGVVLVSISYRVNILGFFAHPELTKESEHHTSGNYGILDQIAGLKWVKENIAAFGGDPEKVTIFGESAGAGSVNILQATPLAKGLFTRAIGESTSQMDGHGNAGSDGYHTLAQAEQAGVAFAQSVGAKSIADLRKMPADMLALKTVPQRPVENDNYVLPGEVYDLYAAGKENKVDLLVGSNGEEGKVLHSNYVSKPTDDEKATYKLLYGDKSDPIRFSATDAVQWEAVSWATLSRNTSHKPTYLYYFRHNPPPRPGERESAGPVHASEMIYVFNNLQTRKAAWTDADKYIADLMSSYWTNFAKTGNPNGAGLPQWPEFDPAAAEVMEFIDKAAPTPMPHQEALHFFDRYFKRLRNERKGHS
jgi:para-nitrobenzyl esterase